MSTVICLLVFQTGLSAEATPIGCLYSQDALEHPPLPDDCPDLLGLAEVPEIREIATLLDVDLADVEFAGCDGIPFATTQRIGIVNPTTYVIFYPADSTSAQDIVGPIAHELGHVYQLETHGGLVQLQAAWKGLEIELGADFLAGVSLRHVYRGLATAKFQHSLALIGKYGEEVNSVAAHGTPEQRVQAFRFGYFLPFKEFDNNVSNAYAEFNANRLRGIVRRG